MSFKDAVEKCLKIPTECCRSVGRLRTLCLVSTDWLQCICSGGPLVYDPVRWPPPSKDRCPDLLADSYNDVPAPWTRVTVKCIPKSPDAFQCYTGGSEFTDWLDMGYAELLAMVGHENLHNQWRNWQSSYNKLTQRKYTASFINNSQDITETMRNSLCRLLKCPIHKIGSLNLPIAESSKKQTPNPNTLTAYAILESDIEFFVVQPYLQYTVDDLVKFSPTILDLSHAQPLWIIYQVLQAVNHCHKEGIMVGDVTLRDLVVDKNLWVCLAVPHVPLTLLISTDKVEGNNLSFSSHSNSLESTTINLSDQQSLSLIPDQSAVSDLTEKWVRWEISNYDYLMAINELAGRQMHDPNYHPVLPWVMDFSSPTSGFRDLTKSKYRLTKGDRQLDLTYDPGPPNAEQLSVMSRIYTENMQVAHHISDVLSDITYYVYRARQEPKAVLCNYVRSVWVPNEYPSSMQRMVEWSPDECIPEFFTDTKIFSSTHDDLPDLEVPPWASSVEDFIEKHMAVLQGHAVSKNLHHWIDLTFGFKLSGDAAVEAKNVCLQLVDGHTKLVNHGVVQLFSCPHPPRQWPPPGVDDGHPPIMFRPLVTVQKSRMAKRESIDEKRLRADNPLESLPITLPDGYKPLEHLQQLEAALMFSGVKPADTQDKDSQVRNSGFTNFKVCEMKWRDMQVVGCLMLELLMAPELRTLGINAPLAQRYRQCCQQFASNSHSLPRPVLDVIELLLDPAGHHEVYDDDEGCLFEYPPISSKGLPPPEPGILVQPLVTPVGWPAYFPHLYTLLTKKKKVPTATLR